ncbi:MAG: RimK family alpha-L-glutamate ligase [Acidobacteriota bacterium]
MKKIGILFGQENTFPRALVDRINEANEKEVVAEFVTIDKVIQARPTEYAVIIDRISQDIPFYRTYLKNAALAGAVVINNPFWWSADDKFFNNALAEHVGVHVPKTALLPSKEHPENTDERSMRNLAYPLDWEAIFDYLGFPAFLKPFAGGGWRHVYRVKDREEFFRVYDQTAQLVMMLQEEIVFTEYYRCYCIDRQHVRIMEYDPRQPFHLQYSKAPKPVEPALLGKMEEAVLRLNRALGYDFNTVELAIRDGVPYAIDFCNPAPDADVASVGEENFKWVVETVAGMAIRKAKVHKAGQIHIEWGEFVAETSTG